MQYTFLFCLYIAISYVQSATIIVNTNNEALESARHKTLNGNKALKRDVMITGYGTGMGGGKKQMQTDMDNCPDTTMLEFIKNTLVYYAGTNDANGIAKRIANWVLNNYNGQWMVTSTQLFNNASVQSQWAYWGSSSVLTSTNWCLYVNSIWEVTVAQVAV